MRGPSRPPGKNVFEFILVGVNCRLWSFFPTFAPCVMYVMWPLRFVSASILRGVAVVPADNAIVDE